MLLASAGVVAETYWASKLTDGTNTVQAVSSAAAPDGSIIVVGTYNTGSTNGFVAKIAKNGSVTWARKLGSGFSFSACAVDSSGNVYATGLVGTNAYIVKYNSSGTIQWQKEYAYYSSYSIPGITVDSSGLVYFGTATPAVVCLDGTGALQWTRNLTGVTVNLYTTLSPLLTTDGTYIYGVTNGAIGCCCSGFTYFSSAFKMDNTGSLVWGTSIADNTTSAASPAIAGSSLVYTSTDGSNNWIIKRAISTGAATYGNTTGYIPYGGYFGTGDASGNYYIAGKVSSYPMSFSKFSTSGAVSSTLVNYLSFTGSSTGSTTSINLVSATAIALVGGYVTVGSHTESYIYKLRTNGTITGSYPPYTYAALTPATLTTGSLSTAGTITASSVTVTLSSGSLTDSSLTLTSTVTAFA